MLVMNMDMSHLAGQEFLRTATFLFAWLLVLVTVGTQRALARKAPEAAKAWRIFLLGVLCISVSISMNWLDVLDTLTFLAWLPVVKGLKLIGVTFLAVGLCRFIQE